MKKLAPAFAAAFLVLMAMTAEYHGQSATNLRPLGTVSVTNNPLTVACNTTNCPPNASQTTSNAETVAFPTDYPLATGGMTVSVSYNSSGASTNATSVKGSAGTLYGLLVVNTTATTYYLRLYNTASAPTCSSATGFVGTIPVLATGGYAQQFSLVGIPFATGIGYCVTGGGGNTDNTNAAAGVYIWDFYK